MDFLEFKKFGKHIHYDYSNVVMTDTQNSANNAPCLNLFFGLPISSTAKAKLKGKSISLFFYDANVELDRKSAAFFAKTKYVLLAHLKKKARIHARLTHIGYANPAIAN